ncbi:hypothetical protein ABVT39_027446 [Epinephelus coioides]
MDNESKQIICMVNIDKCETVENSVIMEKEGFMSTAELESFHIHILMYASKCFCFSPPMYAARVMLAGLDYNHHVDRPAKRMADGSIQYGKVYNKKSRKWSLYTLKVEKDYSYIVDLQSAILLSVVRYWGFATDRKKEA